jgi:hypothetical protein
MLKRALFITLLLVMVFSLSAFAGEGSDTVGGGKLLPQLRYAYSATEWNTTDAGVFHDWDFGAHDYYAQVNWGVFDNLDIFALVGGRSLHMETEGFEAGVGTMTGNADTTGSLLWGFGVKGTFFRADNGFYVGGGAFFTHSLATDFTFSQYLNGVPAGEIGYELSTYTLTPELHVGYHFKNIGLTPYIGVDYTWSRAMVEPEGIKLRMDDPVYMFAGIDHYITDRLYLNFEGRTNFGEGWGMGGGIGYLFDICAKPAPAPAPAPAPVIEPKLEPMSKN